MTLGLLSLGMYVYHGTFSCGMCVDWIKWDDSAGGRSGAKNGGMRG